MTYIVSCILLGVGFFIWLIATITQIQKDLSRMNLTLNKIAKQVGVPDTVTDELKILISEGKNIEAVKKYRMTTGAGLLEAKEYVDSLNELKIK